MSLTDIFPQSPLPCPCKGCNDRYVDVVNRKTCHCTCEKYITWADENRKIHEERYKASLVERGLREYEIKRSNQIRKRTRYEK